MELRELLASSEFNEIAEQIRREAESLGYRRSNGSLVSPPKGHSKLERGRVTSSREERRASRVTTKVVPGRGPRKYRIKLTPADPLPLYSRAQNLVWDDAMKPVELPFTHNCDFSGCRECR